MAVQSPVTLQARWARHRRSAPGSGRTTCYTYTTSQIDIQAPVFYHRLSEAQIMGCKSHIVTGLRPHPIGVCAPALALAVACFLWQFFQRGAPVGVASGAPERAFAACHISTEEAILRA